MKNYYKITMFFVFTIFNSFAMHDSRLGQRLIDDEKYLYQSILDLGQYFESARRGSSFCADGIEAKMHETAKLLEVVSVYNRAVDKRYKDQYSIEGSLDDEELQDFLRLRQKMMRLHGFPPFQGVHKKALLYLNQHHGNYLRSRKLDPFGATLGVIESHIHTILKRRQSSRIRETTMKEIKNRNNRYFQDDYLGLYPELDQKIESVCCQMEITRVNYNHGVIDIRKAEPRMSFLQEEKQRLVDERLHLVRRLKIIEPEEKKV